MLAVFGAMQEKDAEQQVNDMMDVLDKNKDGEIDYKGWTLFLSFVFM